MVTGLILAAYVLGLILTAAIAEWYDGNYTEAELILLCVMWPFALVGVTVAAAVMAPLALGRWLGRRLAGR